MLSDEAEGKRAASGGAVRSRGKVFGAAKILETQKTYGCFQNNGTPKSSIINHPFWGTPIFGNTHMTYSTFFSQKLLFLPGHIQWTISGLKVYKQDLWLMSIRTEHAWHNFWQPNHRNTTPVKSHRFNRKYIMDFTARHVGIQLGQWCAENETYCNARTWCRYYWLLHGA